MSLDGTLKVELRFQQSDSGQLAADQSAELAALAEALTIPVLTSFRFGENDDEINIYWHARLTLPVLSDLVLTLDDGSLIDPATGLGVSFDRIVLFYLKPVSQVVTISVAMDQSHADSWNTAYLGGEFRMNGGDYTLAVSPLLGWKVLAGKNKIRLASALVSSDCDILIVGRGTRS